MVGMTLNFRSFLPLYLKYALNPDWPADYCWRYLQAETRGSDEFEALDALNRANIDRYSEQHPRDGEARADSEQHRHAPPPRGDQRRVRRGHHRRRGAGRPHRRQRADHVARRSCSVQIGLEPEGRLAASSTPSWRPSPTGTCTTARLPRYYALGGYEVTECLLAPEWHEMYMATAKGVLRRLWDRRIEK
jgi:hypothetical protein